MDGWMDGWKAFCLLPSTACLVSQATGARPLHGSVATRFDARAMFRVVRRPCLWPCDKGWWTATEMLSKRQGRRSLFVLWALKVTFSGAVVRISAKRMLMVVHASSQSSRISRISRIKSTFCYDWSYAFSSQPPHAGSIT